MDRDRYQGQEITAGARLGFRASRIRAYVLFITCCAVFFFVALSADQRACIRSQVVRSALRVQSELLYSDALRAEVKASQEAGAVRAIDKQAANDDLRYARELNAPQLSCPFLFPEVRGSPRIKR